MFQKGKLIICCLTILVCLESIHANRVYIRHKRSTDKVNGAEDGEVPKRQTTVIAEGPNAMKGVKDFENEISAHDENCDCKDMVEFDYNPVNDALFFNGRIPSMFHTHHVDGFENMFHQMLMQASRLFQNANFGPHFPSRNATRYPPNYNGTNEEIVTIGGKRFLKKDTVLNKKDHGMTISIMSTVLEPLDDDDVKPTTEGTPDSSQTVRSIVDQSSSSTPTPSSDEELAAESEQGQPKSISLPPVIRSGPTTTTISPSPVEIERDDSPSKNGTTLQEGDVVNYKK